MSFNEDFDEIFKKINALEKESSKKIQEEIATILRKINGGNIEGTWKTEEINEPGMKGWISWGSFRSHKALEPIDPLKPQKRRPLPEEPFEIPEGASEEKRRPLTDVFEEEKATKVYVELPGEEKEDIQLKVKEGSIEVKAKNFHEKIHLPNNNVSTEEMTTDYKNGLLTITLPKRIPLRKEDTKKQKAV